ncbi:N-methyl-D-aspartate receptor NMDAR2C subunit [Steroidobacter flavus]|uniref:N-methyl-D-aspartate receptor NMDAR2C subunit n=1 Tax=Steroidobacter flavus TaxID=1842136 RepID=A0ABV8SWX5_9GAMM
MNRDRWHRLMAAFALPESNETFEQLVDAYSQKHRRYHTGVHIEHCLREFDSASELAQEPAEVELALWFHDAVYDPLSSSNEAKSADLACALLNRHGVSSERVSRVHAHIMATRHEAPAALDDSKLLVDVDLSILGVDEAAYATFEKQVREEYRWVPGPLFRSKRAEILESFLARPTLYSTSPFRTKYEAPARRNLTSAIAALRGE